MRNFFFILPIKLYNYYYLSVLSMNDHFYLWAIWCLHRSRLKAGGEELRVQSHGLSPKNSFLIFHFVFDLKLIESGFFQS